MHAVGAENCAWEHQMTSGGPAARPGSVSCFCDILGSLELFQNERLKDENNTIHLDHLNTVSVADMSGATQVT